MSWARQAPNVYADDCHACCRADPLATICVPAEELWRALLDRLMEYELRINLFETVVLVAGGGVANLEKKTTVRQKDGWSISSYRERILIQAKPRWSGRWRSSLFRLHASWCANKRFSKHLQRAQIS